ncbi:HlyD family efflux transporter periplasmic adaptor subunit [Paraneptunicella aestuarii]|uniref:efflux RND transporter periplasmic adaptor subunit n=1 Tax=Paraneptunicella aestuarii TaxID=2831148 RepID=UPI001E2E052E|nr:HlyD family efflux transporter periplasmic adaptor subunit [Paraneptunicella aestuarii]UAA37222.1 HlyD family efflux transporter periplasmic adaptor subunit [Paraneptunicella aestuarii]
MSLYKLFVPESSRTVDVEGEVLSLSQVIEGNFDDRVTIRANVQPLESLYLDAIEGGRVEDIYVEDGELVEEGQLMLVLSNPAVQISVIRSDADTTQQLNNIRTLELQLEQNRLSHKKNLIDINYQIRRLRKKLERSLPLVKDNVLMKADLEDTQIELDWYVSQREVTLESQQNDIEMQEVQIGQLKKASEQLEKNLAMARKNLENLSVKAPRSGRLTSFELKKGQAVGVGVRIGQIDDPLQFKLVADIGEFYLERVHVNQKVEVTINDKVHQLYVAKIYPQVTNNTFKVDLKFDGESPADFRRGQTVIGNLQLGESTSANLIEYGSFYQETGGNWVFVLSDDGTYATKRKVQLGRHNSKYIEVLNGLELGEFIVSSSYSGYEDKDVLEINSR